jgi:hypothetical protein
VPAIKTEHRSRVVSGDDTLRCADQLVSGLPKPSYRASTIFDSEAVLPYNGDCCENNCTVGHDRAPRTCQSSCLTMA